MKMKEYLALIGVDVERPGPRSVHHTVPCSSKPEQPDEDANLLEEAAAGLVQTSRLASAPSTMPNGVKIGKFYNCLTSCLYRAFKQNPEISPLPSALRYCVLVPIYLSRQLPGNPASVQLQQSFPRDILFARIPRQQERGSVCLHCGQGG